MLLLQGQVFIACKARAPVRRLRKPPVRAPAAMEFQGSSLCRTATSVQSKVENRPPQTAKLPPMRGASRRMACAEHPGESLMALHAARRRHFLCAVSSHISLT